MVPNSINIQIKQLRMTSTFYTQKTPIIISVFYYLGPFSIQMQIRAAGRW